MSKAMLKFTTQCGIEQQHTVQVCPQQNGVAECANRILSEHITAILAESGLTMAFWGEALGALIHCGIDAPQLLWTMPPPSNCGMDANQMCPTSKFGDQLLMCISRRTNITHSTPTMRNVSSLGTQMDIKVGSSTIPLPSAPLSLRGLISMEDTLLPCILICPS